MNYKKKFKKDFNDSFKIKDIKFSLPKQDTYYSPKYINKGKYVFRGALLVAILLIAVIIVPVVSKSQNDATHSEVMSPTVSETIPISISETIPSEDVSVSETIVSVSQSESKVESDITTDDPFDPPVDPSQSETNEPSEASKVFGGKIIIEDGVYYFVFINSEGENRYRVEISNVPLYLIDNSQPMIEYSEISSYLNNNADIDYWAKIMNNQVVELYNYNPIQ